MKAPPFTPGPWHVRGLTIEIHPIVGEKSFEEVARVAVGETAHADARAISAVPDMFAALERAAVALGGIGAGQPIARAKLEECIAIIDRALLKAGWSR